MAECARQRFIILLTSFLANASQKMWWFLQSSTFLNTSLKSTLRKKRVASDFHRKISKILEYASLENEKKSPFLLESKSKFDWGQSLRYVRSTLASISVRALDFVVIGHKLSRTTKANSPKAGEREKRSWLTRTTLAFHALASSARMQYSRLQAEYSAHSPPNSLTLSLVQLRKLDKSSGPVRTTSRSMSSRPTFGECMGCMVLTLHSCIPL